MYRRSEYMEAPQESDRKKLNRLAVTERLRKFYNELTAVVTVDTDDFYRRVMEQAERRRELSTHL